MSNIDAKVVAKAVFFIEGDPDAYEYQSYVIEESGALWFVANWLEELSTGKQIPGELIPMERLPNVVQSDGLFQLATLIPKELGSYPMPEKLRLAYGAVDSPALVHIQGPKSIQ